MECFDWQKIVLAPEGYYGSCIGNVLKYLYRAGRKTPSRIGDLIKARDYLTEAIEFLEDHERDISNTSSS